MVRRYLESRQRVQTDETHIAADAMRYVHARQQLGQAVVVCEDPQMFLELARKQWSRLSRTLQRQRAASSDATRILAFTHAITRMQQTELVACLPEERPGAAVFFVTTQELRMTTLAYPTLCLTAPVSPRVAAEVIGNLPASSLVVDYLGQLELGDYGLLSRRQLEGEISAGWRRLTTFLTAQGVTVAPLRLKDAYASGAFDDAVDALLPVHGDFLARAMAFQHTIELARPLRAFPKSELEHYELVIRLANQVQTLTPGYAQLSFMEGVLSDTFFFNDTRPRTAALVELIAHHRSVGRAHLATALQRWAASSPNIFTNEVDSSITASRTLLV